MKIMAYQRYLAFLVFTEYVIYVKIQRKANLVGWLYDTQTHFHTKVDMGRENK